MGVASPALTALAHSGNLPKDGTGKARSAAGREIHKIHTLAAARVGPGALRGFRPRIKEGRRPDRPELQWSVVSRQ